MKQHYTSGFAPDKTTQTMLRDRASVAYIMRDGVVVIEQLTATAKAGKETIRRSVEVAHLFPCTISFGGNWPSPWERSNLTREELSDRADLPTVRRIVVHDPRLLISGVEAVEVYFNNRSKKMEDMGLTSTFCRLTAPNGQRVNESQYAFSSGYLSVQPNIAAVDPFSTTGNWTKDCSVKDFDDTTHFDKIVWHGSLKFHEPAEEVTP